MLPPEKKTIHDSGPSKGSEVLGVRTDCQLSFVRGTTLLEAALAAVEATGAVTESGTYPLTLSNHDDTVSRRGFCCCAIMVRGRRAKRDVVRRMLVILRLASFRGYLRWWRIP